MINRLFGKLYWIWFGHGEAYRSPLHYQIANTVKRLAGDKLAKDEPCIHASSIEVFSMKRVVLQRCTWLCQRLYWSRKDGILWHSIGWIEAIRLLMFS